MAARRSWAADARLPCKVRATNAPLCLCRSPGPEGRLRAAARPMQSQAGGSAPQTQQTTPATPPAEMSTILTCTLALAEPDETPRVGSPCNLLFCVRNNSAFEIGLHLGGDYRNRSGRPDSFTCTVERDHSGIFLPQLDCGINFGGVISPSRILPGECACSRFADDDSLR